MNGETKQKRNYTVTFRLSEAMFQALRAQMHFRGTDKKTDYFRGLLYLDVALSGHNTDALDKESWMSLAYSELLRAAPNTPARRFSVKPEIATAAPTRGRDAKKIREVEVRLNGHADRGSARRSQRKAAGS